MTDLEYIAARVIDAAFRIHRDLGPGLLESVYERILARELILEGLKVERRKAVGFTYRGFTYTNGLTVDLLVERQLVVELKSVEQLAAVHFKQLLTYLRCLDLPLGLLINFGAARLSHGVRRVVNGYGASPSRRRVR